MQLPVGSSAATSFARCSSRGEISSEPAPISSTMRGSMRGLVALAGDDKGLIQEPEAAVLLQDLARRVEVTRASHRLGEPQIVDLRDVDRGVPRGEERRGADRRGNLGGQRM